MVAVLYHDKKKVLPLFALPLLLIPFLVNTEAQILTDDQDLKYQRVQYYIVYDSTKQTTADLLVLESNREIAKYSFKDKQDPERKTLTEKGTIQYEVQGYLTFTNERDAQAYYNKIIPMIKNDDVVYALIYLLENNHHKENPDPDVVIEKIEYGNYENVNEFGVRN